MLEKVYDYSVEDKKVIEKLIDDDPAHQSYGFAQRNRSS